MSISLEELKSLDKGPLPVEFSLSDYSDVLRARKGTLLGTFVVVLLAVVVITYAQTPVFRASSLLLIDVKKPNVANLNVHEVYDMALGVSAAEHFKTQLELLRSRRIFEPVVEKLKIKYPDAGLTPKQITIDPLPDSRLVRVSVESSDKSFATDAANELVDHYVEDSMQRSLGISDRGLQEMRDMERSLRPKFEELVRQEQDFKDENNLSSLDETQSSAGQHLRTLGDELAKMRIQITKAAADVAESEAAERNGIDLTSSVSPGQMGTMSATGMLRMELLKAQLERREFEKRVRADHPLLKDLDIKVATLKEQLEAERKIRTSSLKAELAVLQTQEKALESEVTKADATLRETGRKIIRFQFLKHEAESVEASYKAITQRMNEVTMAIATGSKENNVFIIDRAVIPIIPVRPDRKMSISLGVLAGIVSSILACFLLERLSNTLRAVDEVERLMGYQIVGTVPRVEKRDPGSNGNGSQTIELQATSQPRGALAESFRTIRTALSFVLPPGSRHMIVVTSPAPGDGKTFSSVNLACSLAQTGKKVLLVDADLRRPRVHRVFGFPESETGFSTLLAQGSSIAEVVRRAAAPGLDVITAGPVPPNPAELLLRSEMAAFLEQARSSYDWVILDAPPILSVADASIIFAQTQLALLVMRTFVTNRRAAKRARDLLGRVPGKVLGVILNNADKPRGYGAGYYGYYQYGYGYGYHASDTADRAAPKT